MKRLLLSVFAAAITAAFVIPASATAGDITLSGQYLVRGEFRGSPQFVVGNNQSIYLQRIRLHADAQATDDVSVKITLQDTAEWGQAEHGTGGPGLTDGTRTNQLDLHESYLNIENLLDQPIDLRVGTQQLAYGDQRLIGAFNWNASARSFDAIKATYKSDAANVDIFTAKIGENTTGVLPNSNGGGDADQDLLGVYATVKSIENNTLDLYYLYLRDGSNDAMVAVSNHSPAVGTVNATQTLATYGARLKGAFQDFDYTAEIAIQSGDIPTSGTDVDLKGTAYAVKVGYKLPTAIKAKVGAQYVYASGDDSATDNENGTFSNLFPTNHGHMGYADQQAWRNVAAWSLDVNATLSDKLGVKAAYWAFALAEQNDDWYHAGRWMTAETITARLSNGTDDDVGTEIDLVATYKYNSAVTAQLGISRFMVGDLVETNVGSSLAEDQDFAYLQLVGNF